jgi:DNA-binding transcriptional LysR family regulator
MHYMNDFLATLPFDLYELSLFHLVAKSCSFTKAAQQAGLTQSAITRQIRGIEVQLGISLFERTTRHVALSPAGKVLYDKSRVILDSTGDLLRELRHEFHLVPRTLRVGVARSIGLAYLPGYFFAFQKQAPRVQLQVCQRTSNEILLAVETRELDAGLLCPPVRLPATLQTTHRFADDFTIILPPDDSSGTLATKATVRLVKQMLKDRRWLLIDREGNTGRQLHQWLRQQEWSIQPAMELDSFDAIVNLVSLGLGVSIVPHRVLPLYRTRREVRRINIKPRFSRELAVVVRKNRQQPEPLAAFIESILF